MKRLFWLAAGAAIGVVAVRRLSRQAQELAPRGTAARLGRAAAGALFGVRDFTRAVREGMAEREAQLYQALGTDDRPAEPERLRDVVAQGY